MNKKFIENIEVALPKKTQDLKYLLKILKMCNNIKIHSNSLIQTTLNKKFKPTITFTTKATKDPMLSFTGPKLDKESFNVGKLPIIINSDYQETNSKATEKPSIITKSDKIGKYLQVKWPFATYNQLNFKQLFNRITTKVTSLDHVGVNINSRFLSKSRYKKMKKIIANSSCFYDFPHKKEWPFILPASLLEQQKGIKLGIKRDPKFEFVYNFAYPYPEIQLDIQTNLSPKKVLALFPPPYGYYDPTPKTANCCSSVFIYTGWANVSLRIDLRFYTPNYNWTDWLINTGKRVKF